MFRVETYIFGVWLQLKARRRLCSVQYDTVIQMEVLKKSKFTLRLGNLSNKRGFYLHKWRIPNLIVDSIFLLPMFVCALQMLIVCFNIGPRLKEISSSIYLMLGISSILAIYVCLAAKNDVIIQTLDHLQEMVTLRKILLF